jgi:2-oxoglutarate dehydrogenase E1 component
MAYVDSLYEDYLADPASVSADWQTVFSSLPQVNGSTKDSSHRDVRDYFLQNADKKRTQMVQSADSQQYQVANLVHDFRSFGHLAAKLDPLEMTQPTVVPGLDLATHQLANIDKNRSFFSGTRFNGPEMPLGEIYQALRDTYCGSIGIEYMHISNKEEIEWIQQSDIRIQSISIFNQHLVLFDFCALPFTHKACKTKHPGLKITHLNLPIFIFNTLYVFSNMTLFIL